MIAFVLVFATILTSVALLSTVGFQSMTDYQEGEQLRNAERAMETLANNFNDVLQDEGIERRTSGLSLREGTVTTGTGGTAVNISVDGTYIGDRVARNTSNGSAIDLGTFAYEAGSDTIAYEGGGVVRASNDGGSVVLERPQLKCSESENRAIVSLVAIDADDRSLQSSGNAEFRIVSQNRETYVRENVDNVSVDVTETEYDGAWKATLEQQNWNGYPQATCDPSGSDMTVIVTVVEADIQILTAG